MRTSSNLIGYAEACVSEAALSLSTLDTDKLRKLTSDQVWIEADNACTYTDDALAIISNYESNPAAADADDRLPQGKAYTAAEWSTAMTEYAKAIATCVIEAEAWALIDKINGSADVIGNAAREHGAPADDESEPHLSQACPYGWARHDKEDKDGVHYWTERHIEGCRAVALKVGGVWLSHTWTPAPPASPEAASAEQE